VWVRSCASCNQRSRRTWFLLAYIGMQVLASIAVIPVWRRLVVSASLRPPWSMTGDRAFRS
jgi:hypothetical protein